MIALGHARLGDAADALHVRGDEDLQRRLCLRLALGPSRGLRFSLRCL